MWGWWGWGWVQWHMEQRENWWKDTCFGLSSHSILVLWRKHNSTFFFGKKKLTGGSCVFCRLGFTVHSGCVRFTLFGRSTQNRTLAGTRIPILCFCILQGNWNAPLQSELGVGLYIFLLSGTQIVSQGICSLFFQHLCLIPQIDYHVSLRFPTVSSERESEGESRQRAR